MSGLPATWPNHYPGLSRPLDAPKLRVVSYGAGVQSTTMLLMAAAGQIGPMPDCAIFADTGDEPEEVYAQLRWITSPNVGLPFPVHTVSAGSLRQEMLDSVDGIANAWGRPPVFIRNEDGKIGQARRQCTQDYKIEPIQRKVRELIGLKKRQRNPKTPVVEQWIGISTDEIGRLKPSFLPFIHNRHPLVELNMSRGDCLQWLERNGFPKPPKSACRVCPFRKNSEWLRLRDQSPADFEAACEVDDAIRTGTRLGMTKGLPFLHRSGVPLRDAQLADASAADQHSWLGECEGMCGV